MVFITLPPSKHGQTVIVTKSQVRVLENQPVGPPTLIYLSQLSGSSGHADISTPNNVTTPNTGPPSEAIRVGGDLMTPTIENTPTIDVTNIGTIMDMLSLQGSIGTQEISGTAQTVHS